MSVSLNTKPPLFCLKDQNNSEVCLDDFTGKWILIYFYPKDFTPGCTTEACQFRDYWNDLQKLDAVVLGVSADSVASHKKFEAEHELPFPLLSDEDRKVINAYGVWREKKMFGRSFMGIARTSFLISPDFVIAKVYENVRSKTHAKQVFDDITSFSSAA